MAGSLAKLRAADRELICRYALWWGLLRGCEKVEKLAAEKRSEVKDAVLDWFGVATKAQDITSFVTRMNLLAERVSHSLAPHDIQLALQPVRALMYSQTLTAAFSQGMGSPITCRRFSAPGSVVGGGACNSQHTVLSHCVQAIQLLIRHMHLYLSTNAFASSHSLQSHSLQIQAARSPEQHYRIEDVMVAQPKWGPACGWTEEDDQKLLLGCFWYSSLSSLPPFSTASTTDWSWASPSASDVQSCPD